MAEAPEWIYGNDTFFPEEVERLEKVEKALGFKLFFWQKTYILRGYFRRNGETTAIVLRDLLQMDRPPIDFTEFPRTNKENIYRHELMKIKEQLEAAGIETRPVLRSRGEKQEYLKLLKAYEKREGKGNIW